MKSKLLFLALVFILSIGYGQGLDTPTLSPLSKTTQEFGLTSLSLEYSRPSARGRTVFGSLVPYNQIWRTGANASSKLTFQDPIIIAGTTVAPGSYAIYTIPGETQWTVIIHKNTSLRSLAGDAYNPENDVFRFSVTPRQTQEYIESFTMQFTGLKTDGVTLELSWENTVINIPIRQDVDLIIQEQLATLMLTPDDVPHRTYFEAAQYYYSNNKQLFEAMAYINAALEKSPENFRYGLLKAKIQDKAGAKEAAIKTINMANQWAKNANNANYIEQTELFKQSLLVKD